MTDTHKPAAPTIHLNGSGAPALIGDLEKAVDALRAASFAVGKTCANGRDYCTQPGDGFARAVREHRSRLDRLLAVRDELESVWMQIREQS